MFQLFSRENESVSGHLWILLILTCLIQIRSSHKRTPAHGHYKLFSRISPFAHPLFLMSLFWSQTAFETANMTLCHFQTRVTLNNGMLKFMELVPPIRSIFEKSLFWEGLKRRILSDLVRAFEVRLVIFACFSN